MSKGLGISLLGLVLLFNNSPYYKQLMNPFGVPKVTINKPGFGPWRTYVGIRISF